jgi:omega-6 fatty acid desaturase (delta-12 desaturase)
MTRTGKDLILATKPFAQEIRWRSWWALGSTLALLVGLLAVACLDITWLLRLPASILAALVLVRLFVIYHDYLHGAILRDSRLADGIFSIYGLLQLSPRSAWKESHDHHHHHNGQYFGLTVGTFPLMTTDQYAQASRWQRLKYALVRHPLTILFGYFTVFLYAMCLKDVIADPRRHLDAYLAILLQAALVAGLAIFAPAALVFAWLLPVLLASALGAYLFYAQHNFPGARYRDRAHWDFVAAALESSSYLRQGRLLHWLTGNIGYHHVHHLNAHIPFYRLPEAMAGIDELRSPRTTSLHPFDVYHCLRLKLWDPWAKRLVTFREGRQSWVRGNAAQAAESTGGAGQRQVPPSRARRPRTAARALAASGGADEST